jgi:peptidoglycan hydrolase-like protein with peptidoglycan-binding domain
MRIARAAMLGSLALSALTAGEAQAFTLMIDGSLEVHVTDGTWCEPTITMEVRSPDPLPFTGDKIPVRRIVGILQQILQLDCPAAQALEILGVVVDQPVYAGRASLADGALVDGPAPAASDRLPLERAAQVREAQTLLAELGFDPGPADGAAGRRTKAAAAAFRAERGLPEGDAIDLAFLRALRAASGIGNGVVPAVAAVDPSALHFADYAHYTDQEEPARSAEPFARRLALAAVRRDPSLLESRGAVLEWFEADNPYLGVAPDTELRRRWDAANAVERDVILDEYRAALLAEAAAVVPPTPEAPWRVALVHRASVAGYAPGRGLELSIMSPDHIDLGIVRLQSKYLRGTMSATAPALPDVSVLPTQDDAVTSALMDRIEAEGSLLVTWLSIEKIGVDDVLGSVVTPDPGVIPLTIRVEAVTLNTRAEVVDYAPVPGDLLGAFPLAGEAAQRGGIAAAAAAERLGIPVFDGHVALLDTAFAMGDITGSGFFDSPYRLARDRFLYLAGYLANPPEDYIQEELDYIGRSILDASQFSRVFGDGYQSRFDDEFERRRGVEVLRDEVMPAILADAATFPMPVVSVRAMRLGDYEFETQTFALEDPQSDEDVIDLEINLVPRIRVEFLQPFPPLPMPEANARDLLARREHANRRIYLAAYGDLRMLAEPTDSQELAFDPRRLVLYADERLTEVLVEYDVAAFIPPAIDAPRTLTDEERRAQAYAALEAEPGTTIAGLAAVADRLLPGTGFLGAFLRTSGPYLEADEFSRDAALAATAAAVAAEAPPAETFLLPGRIRLGDYDVSAGTFAATEISLGTAYSDAGYFRGDVDAVVRNLAALAALPVERAAAEAAVRQVPDRAFQIRAEVRAVVADADLEEAEARVGVEVVRLHLLVPRANGGGAFVVTVDVASGAAPDAAGTVAFPDRLMLTPDVAQLLAVRAMPRPIPEAALRTLYLDRYVFETRLGTPIDARFFGDVPPPDNLSFTQDAERFAAWLETVSAALPDRYTLVWDLAPPGANLDNCALAQVEDAPAAYQEGRELGVLAAPSWVEGVPLELALPPSGGTSGCYDATAGGIGDELGIEEHYWLSQRVLLDRLPVYDFDRFGGLNVELDLALERVELEAAEGSFPNVRLFGRTEQGRVVPSVERGADGIVDGNAPSAVAIFEPPAAGAAAGAGKTPPATAPAAATDIDDLLLAELTEAPPAAAPEPLVLVADQAFDDSVGGFAISAGGRLALVGLPDSLLVWDLKKGVAVRQLIDHGGYAAKIAWSPDGRRALVVHEDAVRLWDIGSASAVATYPREWLRAVAFAPDGASFYVEGDNGVEERSLSDGSTIRRLGEGTFSLSPDGLLMAVFTTLGAEIVETAGSTAIRRLAFDAWPISAAFSPDGGRVAFGLADGRILVHDVASGAVTATLEGHRAGVSGLAFADGRRLVSASEDGTIRVWDVDTGREIGEGLHARDTLIGGPYVFADGLSAVTTHYGLKRWALPAP